MTSKRIVASALLIALTIAAFGNDFIAPYNIADQFRQHLSAPPSRNFLLGTDEFGRDRFSRLIKGSGISVFCALSAAAIATGFGGVVGVAAGYAGGWVDELLAAVIDLFLSLPWLFAMLTLRSLLPLSVPAWVSVSATFLLLAAVGWAPGARLARAGAIQLRQSQFVCHARAYGCSRRRLLFVHMLPNLSPVFSAQFWSLVPVFLLAEANLGMLGLGVVAPLPSLGNMLAELKDYERIPEEPWILTPAVLLFLIVAVLHLLVSEPQKWEQE
jgi:peptide/nickel transport system permease protein